jgi:hypothetical protein
MFLISSEFWPKLAHHHCHSGLTSFWVKRSKRPVIRLLECVVLPSLLFWTHRNRQGYIANRMSRSGYVAKRCHSCFFLWGIRFTFYILHPPPAAQGTEHHGLLASNAAYIRKISGSNLYPDTNYPAVSYCSLPDVCRPFFLKVFLKHWGRGF